MRITEIKPYCVWGGFKNYLFVKIETDEGIWRHRRGRALVARDGRSGGCSPSGVDC